VAVIRTSTNGTARTAHFVRREIVRLASAEEGDTRESISSVAMFKLLSFMGC
jgi:hypothetical protein